MGDRRVLEALDQLVHIVVEIHAGHRIERLHRLRHVAANQRPVFRHGHDIAHEREVFELAEIGNQRMGAVEQPQLHLFIGLDVIDEKRAAGFPPGPAGREMVLDHPLHEGFGAERQPVFGAGQGFSQSPRLVGRRRHDAIDHAGRKGAVACDPVGERRIAGACHFDHQFPDDTAIGRKVVAAEHGKGCQTGGVAARKPSTRYPITPVGDVGSARSALTDGWLRSSPPDTGSMP